MNAAQPWQIALIRALLSAGLVGASTFLALWLTTDELKPLIIGTLTPVIGVLSARFAAEGWIDQKGTGGTQ